MKILVVEDHVLMREALRGVLKELKGDAAVIIEAPDSRQAMRQIEQNPDVELVLLDLGLPERQMEVLALMMRGKSNKAICRVLDLAEPTVKIHVSAILKALKVANRTEAVLTAAALGLGPQQDVD